MSIEIESRVCGIPCIISVDRIEPFTPGRFFGPPELCFPDEGGEIEWTLLDRRGRRAGWLERKMNDRDRDQVLETILNKIERE